MRDANYISPARQYLNKNVIISLSLLLHEIKSNKTPGHHQNGFLPTF